MNSQDELAKTYNLYGVFLSNNTFVVCAETLFVCEQCLGARLYNLFDNTIVEELLYIYNIYNKNTILPWNGKDIFLTRERWKAIAFPIEELLTKNCLEEITTKRNLSVASDVINEY